jgi:hypothetical protein
MVLLLCAGCRVGVCIQDFDDVHMGCLEPSTLPQEDDFIYYCPFCCAREKKTSQVSAELQLLQSIS